MSLQVGGLVADHSITSCVRPIEPIASKISTVLFVVIVIGALASEWDAFIANVGTLGPSMVILILTMLFIGFKSAQFFKMNAKRAVTVAIESGIQNATVGITIGNIIMNQETGLSPLSLPSGVYGILMYLVCLPFVFWFLKRKR